MKKNLWTLSLLSTLVFALSQTPAKAEDVILGEDDGTGAPITYITLAWDRNPENNIALYNVYYGRISGDYSRVTSVTGLTVLIGLRGTKTFYFAATAVNTDGVESDVSDEVHWP